MNKLIVILILSWNNLLVSPLDRLGVKDPVIGSKTEKVSSLIQERADNRKLSDSEKERQDIYQRALEQVAATESMKQLHANYAELGSPFKEMTTVQFADLFHRSQGFTLPGTREVGHNMYLQGWSSEIPALSDPEPDDCTPEEIEAWYRKFYDPWNARRPAPTPWARELPFVDPQPFQLVEQGFTVIGGRGYRWGIVLSRNASGDYEAIGQLKPDYKPPVNSGDK